MTAELREEIRKYDEETIEELIMTLWNALEAEGDEEEVEEKAA